jgi:BirA family transcriptional regulator, biotin operon repressor / biotin---[acetyl-CoA-carboxylase] ligase
VLPGVVVEALARCDSTNSELLRRARTIAGRRRDEVAPTLLVAEHQTRGRGRRNRPWLSAPGASLTFSLALPLAPADWSGLSLAVGVALAEALDPLDPPDPLATTPRSAPRIGLKWPNDLWLWEGAGRGRKLGGILIETVAVGAHRIAVVGVGLNVRPLADRSAEVPADVMGGASVDMVADATAVGAPGPTTAREASAQGLSQGLASLSELDPAATAPATLARVAPPLAAALLAFAREGLAPVQAAYARRDVLAGRAVHTLHADDRPALAGTADGIDADGALRLRRPQGVEHIASGEVSVRLPAGDAMASASAGTDLRTDDRPC